MAKMLGGVRIFNGLLGLVGKSVHGNGFFFFLSLGKKIMENFRL